MSIMVVMVYLVIACYLIIKNKDQPFRKVFSILSLFLFVTMATPFWNEQWFDVLLNKGFFVFFGMGVLGLLFAWTGSKGTVRITLFSLNMIALMFYGILYIVGMIGFQEP